MGWSTAQKKSYAKEVMAGPFQNGRAVTYLTRAMRCALVEAYCFSIVLNQDATTVAVDDAQDLVYGVQDEIRKRWGVNFFDG